MRKKSIIVLDSSEDDENNLEKKTIELEKKVRKRISEVVHGDKKLEEKVFADSLKDAE